ncbi:MAG: chondroitinase-B domain-containing protein [Bacteroidota bacterium]
MKNRLLLICALTWLWSCGKNTSLNQKYVKDIQELNVAMQEASPGTEIVMANGMWKDVPIKFYGQGTEAAPIVLRAETPGEVLIEGESFLHLAGEHLIVEGLYFKNGYSPAGGIISYRISRDSIANHCRVSNCVVDGFTRPNRWERDQWIEFYGRHNQLDHCYIAGKSNDGTTLMVYHKGNEHTRSHHQIVYNYFGPRPRKGGPRAETIRLGGSETSMTPGYVNVSDNYFDACNGEVEIISDKTNFNSFTHNIFDKCEGSLVMRHSDYTTVDGNIFIGGDDSDFYGGIRVINTGHWITNNYFYKIRGEEFRSPLALMNGIPKSSLNRYKQVTDVVVAHNTWVDCRSPWQVGVGQNKASASVLPKSEIRSAPPIRTTVANNIIYNTQPDPSPVVNHDDIKGVLFEKNILDNHGSAFTEYDAANNASLKMKQLNDWLFVPEGGQGEVLSDVFPGFGFEEIQEDLFEQSRSDANSLGAINGLTAAEAFKLDKKIYGPDWFSPEKEVAEPNTLPASSAEGELAAAIEKALPGDIIELGDDQYTIKRSLRINKELTLRSAGSNQAEINFIGAANTPVFEMYPGGGIRLENLSVKGEKNQLAFAPLEKNMSSSYKLHINNCAIEGFGFVLKAYRGSFADSITVSNSSIQNCENGFVLAADEKGDYNAEMVTFDQCTFSNVQRNVIHFYRGGYDESTIGGFLTLSNNTFTNCGKKESSGVLLKTRGIINVFITDNRFQDNPVKLVALLWGAKNNYHSNNSIVRSGQIKVEEQQKLELLY